MFASICPWVITTTDNFDANCCWDISDSGLVLRSLDPFSSTQELLIARSWMNDPPRSLSPATRQSILSLWRFQTIPFFQPDHSLFSLVIQRHILDMAIGLPTHVKFYEDLLRDPYFHKVKPSNIKSETTRVNESRRNGNSNKKRLRDCDNGQTRPLAEGWKAIDAILATLPEADGQHDDAFTRTLATLRETFERESDSSDNSVRIRELLQKDPPELHGITPEMVSSDTKLYLD